MASSRIVIVGKRLMSAAAAAEQKLVKPPIQVFGLDGRYATALYSAATKMKVLDSVEKELTEFQKQIKASPRFRDFIINPTLNRAAKAQAFKDISTSLSLSPATTNLLSLLAENGRLQSLEGIINAFKVIMAAHRGEVTCVVTTARPLDEAQKKSLEGSLKAFLKPGETLLLTTTVDPSIIGGMLVSIGDKYVDMSIATKIKKYSELISAAA